MRQIKEHLKDQRLLFATHYIGDRLADDDQVYLFDKLLDLLDITAITDNYSQRGGAMYSPRCMLSILVYSYFNGITSSRKIENLVQAHLAYIYLAGGYQIKYRAICEFRKKHIASIKSIFTESVKLALESDLIQESDIFALDGSKIEADASGSKTRSKAKWEEKETAILAKVEEFIKEWEETDLAEENLDTKKAERMRKASERIDRLFKRKEQRLKSSGNETQDQKPAEEDQETKEVSASAFPKASEKQGHQRKIKINSISDCERLVANCEKISSMISDNADVPDKTLLNLTDSDTRIMKSDSTTKECFNAQAITNHQVIVAADVTNQENDQNQLQPMVEQLKENLSLGKSKTSKAIKLAADPGYNAGENLAYLYKEKGVDAYISMKNRKEEKESEANPCHKDNFHYDEDEDHYICPEGKPLEFVRDEVTNGKKFSHYAAHIDDCIFCPLNSMCLSNKGDRKRGYRTITNNDYYIYRQEMKLKMKGAEAKAFYRKRSSEVEAVFGQITYNRSFNRFRLRGLESVKGEFLITALAHNLGKIMKYRQEKGKNELKLGLLREKRA